MLRISAMASTPLIVAGASLAVSGGATGLGAGLADLRLSNNTCGEAQTLIDRDVQLTMDLLLLEKVYTIRKQPKRLFHQRNYDGCG